MSVRDDLRELASKKLSALNKYFSDDVTANVTFKVRRDTEIIEVTIGMGNTLFRSEEGADTFTGGGVNSDMAFVARGYRST